MIKITKTNTITKAKTAVKADMTKLFYDFLVEKYGEDSVSMVRTGSSSPVNEICAMVEEADTDGKIYPICITVNPTVKDWVPRVGTKKTFEAFDFFEAQSAYDDYMTEKADKEADKKKKKEEKIAKDEKARADKKSATTEIETTATEIETTANEIETTAE